ncbi:MAG: polyprenyl synthetase family protein [Prevotellaceae bacterium]|jgi:octaprenyl-diphosphate synthase|nr:polyprenyl synthetase family protein [Prevotellaceae bacterium]
MTFTQQLQQTLGAHWTEFTVFFQRALESDIVLLDTINRYLLQHTGKQLRPLLTLLTAGMHGNVNDSSYLAASAVEMIHTSSLLHDDVIDNADERRGAPSVKAVWRSNASVLAGDYWLARIFQLVISREEHSLLPWFANCLVDLSEGELLQLEKSRTLDTTEADYFKIIGKKTASLIAVSMATGALTAGAADDTVQRMYDAGYEIGIAFQIRDDLFDYHKTNLFGKPTGNDLREQKLTLPLLYALSQADEKQRAQVLQWVKDAAKNTRRNSDIVRFVEDMDGFKYAEKALLSHTERAEDILRTFPVNVFRDKLMELARYLIMRKK